MCRPTGEATRFVGARGGGVLSTVTAALPVTPPSDAVTVPVPAAAPARNVVDAPVVGETDPPATVVAHAAPARETAFPYWSAPEAVNGCVPPDATVALVGVTV